MKRGTGKKKTKSKPMGPKALTGSREAKRTAAVLLEVLSGARGTQEGAQALGTSLSRYYLLETRALQGFIHALEPRPKGRQRRPEDELESLRRERRRLEQELGRSQALVRAAQRSLGLSAAKPAERGKLERTTRSGGPKRRRRRVTARAVGAVAALRRSMATDEERRTDDGGRTAPSRSEARGTATGNGRGEAAAASGAGDAER
jgi:hypothetical protein